MKSSTTSKEENSKNLQRNRNQIRKGRDSRANEIAVLKFRPQGRDEGHEAKSWKRVFGEESLKERREGRMKDA